MYMDPSKIRTHKIKLRLSDEENRLIDAWVGYTGEQKAAMLREIIIEQAKEAIKQNNITIKNRA